MLRNLNINQLAPVGFGVVILVTVVTNLIYQSGTNSLFDSIQWVAHTYKVKQELNGLEKLLVDAETGQRGFLFTGKEEFLEPYVNAKQRIPEEILVLKTEIKDNPEQVKNIVGVENLIRQKMDELDQTIVLKRTGREPELRALVLSGKGKQIMDNLRNEIGEMTKIEDNLLVERQKTAAQAQNFSTFFAWGSILTIIIISLIVSWIISRLISRSLGVAVGVAERVSAGELNNKIKVTSNDEIGKLMQALDTMSYNLNSLVSQVQHSGIQVTTSATEIAASGKELEATVTEQIASTNQVLATTKQIAATSSELVKTMEEVAVMSQTTASSASTGQKDLVKMEATMRQLAEATNSISSKLGVISEKANNINTIITTITKVADQTNLLSLNAAIEAEKAGEYGLGFAVVAREIRRLADQTAVATLDIESMVREMQSAVSTGVMEMDKFTKEVSRSVGDVQNISSQTAEIINQVKALTPRFELVNQGMDAQSLGASQISEAMIQLSEASGQTAEALREINRAIAQLNEAAYGLQREISRFTISS